MNETNSPFELDEELKYLELDKLPILLRASASSNSSISRTSGCSTMISAESNEIDVLLSSINSKVEHLSGDTDDEVRKALVREVHRLALAIETPIETTLRLTWANRGLDACLQTGINIGLFESLSFDTPKTCAQLASETGTDTKLLSRILKHLATMDYVNETAANTYTHTKYSKSLTNPIFRDAFPLCAETIDLSILRLSKFLESTNYQNPTDPENGPFQFGHQSPDHFFQLIAKNPHIGSLFNNHMLGYVTGRKSWIDENCYPVRKNLVEGMNSDSPLLVDIGGGTGRDINAFHTKFGGRCILQELPEVVASATPVGDVEVQIHDMFTPQPVHGARAYYLHSVLHDWPDHKCIEILQNIKPAMRKGYSKILVNENVVPATNAYWMTTGLDFVMMSAFASCERTEEAWHKLFEDAGLRVTRIYNYETGSESLIEVELA